LFISIGKFILWTLGAQFARSSCSRVTLAD